MDRINTATKAVDLFGAGKHGFKDGNLATGVLPTDLEAGWFNGVQEELLSLIEAADLVPDSANRSQVLAAINILAAIAPITDVISAINYRHAAVSGCAGFIEV